MKKLLLVFVLIMPSLGLAKGSRCVAHIGHHTYFSCEGGALVPVTYPPFVPSIGTDIKLANTHKMSYIIAEYRGLGYDLEFCEIINDEAESICVFIKPVSDQ